MGIKISSLLLFFCQARACCLAPKEHAHSQNHWPREDTCLASKTSLCRLTVLPYKNPTPLPLQVHTMGYWFSSSCFLFLKFYLVIDFQLCWASGAAWAFLQLREPGSSPAAVPRRPHCAGPLVAAHGLACGPRQLGHVGSAPRLNRRGARAQPLCGAWHLPWPGSEPVSPTRWTLDHWAPRGSPSVLSWKTHAWV